MNENTLAFIEALTGNKIIRKKIYIDKEIIEKLKKLKKHLNSSLEICELVECAFDYFDGSLSEGEGKQSSSLSDSLDKLKERNKESSQMFIREDIYLALNNLKDQSGVCIRQIISTILNLQLTKIKKINPKEFDFL